MKYYILVLVLIASLALSGCYYDVESELYPASACNTPATPVSYQVNILPVIQANCYVCHSNAASAPSGGNIMLEGYTNFQKMAASGRLYAAISHTGPSPMPKGGNKLSDCDIQIIKSWIDAGMLNN
jgi:mono/diheme cytochrome c family protein